MIFNMHAGALWKNDKNQNQNQNQTMPQIRERKYTQWVSVAEGQRNVRCCCRGFIFCT